jgi:radical SAM/Cys-rich protein
MLDTYQYLVNTDFPSIRRAELETLQVNLGYLCNQQCLHCHVDAGPRRTEIMQLETIGHVIEFLKRQNIRTLDLTGGAPEMNPHFRMLVQAARRLDVHVLDRCNLTILTEPGFEDIAAFLADNNVEVIASMPCYLQENVDRQRGKGVFDKSIEGLQRLNIAGYGRNESRVLNLVYNPQGPCLPPPQAELEPDYKKILQDNYGIVFNHLFTIANMPIKRFGSTLLSRGQFEDYMHTLKQAHKAANLDTVMCRSLISVDWRGYVYDCDFNQMLGLDAGIGKGRKHLSELMTSNFNAQTIAVMDHCYGCTAGQGSSCGGALA